MSVSATGTEKFGSGGEGVPISSPHTAQEDKMLGNRGGIHP